MGFFRNKTSSYPGRRAQENRMNNNPHPATVPPPSNYGVQNPPPMPARVYESSGMPMAPPTPQHTTAAPAQATATYNPSAYGALPGRSAPVMATAYVPGQGAAAAPTPSAPAVATAYAPGGAPVQAAQAAQAAQAVHTTAAPVQSVAYNYNQNYNQTTPYPQAQAHPPLNPSYNGVQSQQNFNGNPSYNAAPSQQTAVQSQQNFSGNNTYNTHESTYWECSVCSFPNLRTEHKCKGCGSAIPPGLKCTPAPRPAPPTAQDPTNTNAAAGGGYMRVHIPNGMAPGQKIKVLSPIGDEVIKIIPPYTQWQYDGTKPYFRMLIGPSPTAAACTQYGTNQYGNEAPPPHTTTWNEIYRSASARYAAPPLAVRSVPHAPRGGAGLPPNGRHKSLVIGINYTGQHSALRGCINDAMNMQKLLRRNGFPDDGAHMLLLADERHRGPDHQPTKDNITKAFAWFMHDVRPGDVLFFHFSGHGGQEKDTTGHEADGYNETLIPVDYGRRGQITDDVLWGALVYRLPEGARLTALMDMCHSGTGLDLPFDYNVDRRRWTEDVNPAHSAGDAVLFSGCEDAQTSADVSGGSGGAGGAMTQAFMGAYEAVGCGTYHDFLIAVKQQLRRKRFSQRPQLTASQQFDANSRIFSLGCQSGKGGVPSVIEPNHNPKVGRQLRRHTRPPRKGLFGGGGHDKVGLIAGAIGAALVADAFF